MVLAQTARVLPLATWRVFEGGIDFLIPLVHLPSIAPRTSASHTRGGHPFPRPVTCSTQPPLSRTRDMRRSVARACAPTPRKRCIVLLRCTYHVISLSGSLIARVLFVFFSGIYPILSRRVCASTATVAAPDGSARFVPMSDRRTRSHASSRSDVVRLPTEIRHRRRHHHHRTKG